MSGKSLEDRLKTSEKRKQTLIPPKAFQETLKDDKNRPENKPKLEQGADTPPPNQASSSDTRGESKDSALDAPVMPLQPDKHEGGHLSSQDEINALQHQMGGFSSIEEAGDNSVNPSVSTSNDPFVNHSHNPLPYRPKRYKKERLIDTHEQKSYYMEKEIVQIIDELAGDDTGFKYRFINEAVRLLIHQDYPELAHRLRPQNK